MEILTLTSSCSVSIFGKLMSHAERAACWVEAQDRGHLARFLNPIEDDISLAAA